MGGKNKNDVTASPEFVLIRLKETPNIYVYGFTPT